MKWTTEGIAKLSMDIDDGRDMQSILREISINSVLENSDTEPSFPFYFGNGDSDLNCDLRAANISFEHTEEEQQVLYNFYNNPIELYQFIYPRYITQRYGDKKDFKVFDYEDQWITAYLKNRFNLIFCPKQMGSSDLTVFCVIHYILYEFDRQVCVFDDGDFFLKFICMYECLPFYMKPGIRHQEYADSFFKIVFDNGCVVRCSEDILDLMGPGYHIDFAIMNKPDIDIDFHEVMKYLYPASSAMTHCKILIRLANDLTGYFKSHTGVFVKSNFLREFNLNYLLS